MEVKGLTCHVVISSSASAGEHTDPYHDAAAAGVRDVVVSSRSDDALGMAGRDDRSP